MSRLKWTLMRWDSFHCKYVPRLSNNVSSIPLKMRQRIPNVDKVMQKPIDEKPALFCKHLNHSLPLAQSLVDAWCPDLDVDSLEQYARALALHGNGKGIANVPPETLAKLRKWNLVPQLQGFTSSLSKFTARNSVTPLDLLQTSLPNQEVHAMFQNLQALNPKLTELKLRWTRELTSYMSSSDKRREKPPECQMTVNEYLDIESQCELVASQLAHLAGYSATTKLPKNLTYLCRQLGETLETNLLKQIHARQFNQPAPLFIHRGSEFLWGIAGHAPWTIKHRMALAAFWVQVALKACHFTVMHNSSELTRPAFWKTWHMKKAGKRGVIALHGYLLKQLENMSVPLPADQIPQLQPPRPWTSTQATNVPIGMQDLNLIASASTEGQATVREALRTESMLSQISALNKLQNTAWRINRPVLDVLTQLTPTLECPAQWTQALQIAGAMGTRKFYFPMYMDFRGRSYAASKSLLNFMGQEETRALFVFDEAKPLGTDGLHWLEVHIANLYGQCKSHSFTARRHWVEKYRSEIVASARFPTTTTWWQEGSKPYQILAACMELDQAWSSKSPETFCSRLPVQLDGTSNGLQHLVALARDSVNAPLVNLAPSSAQEQQQESQCGDVYLAVAQQLGIPATDRSQIKQAVMTFFYGASAESIAGLFKSDSSVEKPVETEKAEQALVKSLADKLTCMFAPERAIQNWLVDCAKRIMKSRDAEAPDSLAGGAALVWTSPLGMPVVQPYVETKLIAVRTPLQSFYLPSELHRPEIVKTKQILSVVANYVHTLDAAHMLSTMHALPNDCSFAAVHDSFWTHAGTVRTLNTTLRKTFVDLHSVDLLRNLHAEWTERYKHHLIQAYVHSDSDLYRKLMRDRDSVGDGREQCRILEVEFANGTAQKLIKKHLPKITSWWKNEPHIGSHTRPYVKMWVPIDLPSPLSRGSFDLNQVKSAAYFFS